VTCYELLVFGEPPLNNATIYLDGKVVKSQAVQFTYLKVPYEKHEIRVEQNGFRPFVTILEGGPGRSERRLLVKFESLDSVPATPSQSDIAKTVE
ncbi:MAG TPA: hypothetical protein VNL73_09675, partial [Verrucomicrobiae bacterium]|nr:hypothetical protein [Verrucomicrobiae bacterium]